MYCLEDDDIYCVVYTRKGRFELTQQEWIDFDKRQLHRVSGPAIEYSTGYNAWFYNGTRYRLESSTYGNWKDKDTWWFIGRKPLSSVEVEQWLNEIDIDPDTEEGQIAFILKWA